MLNRRRMGELHYSMTISTTAETIYLNLYRIELSRIESIGVERGPIVICHL